MPRPKGSKKEKILSPIEEISTVRHHLTTKLIRTKKPDDEISSNSSASDFQCTPTRVVVNPAVLRYLEQSRLTPMKTSNQLEDDLNHHESSVQIEDDLFWDISSYPTDFLVSARLAQWILREQWRRTSIEDISFFLLIIHKIHHRDRIDAMQLKSLLSSLFSSFVRFVFDRVPVRIAWQLSLFVDCWS